jgi:hypothetical protein
MGIPSLNVNQKDETQQTADQKTATSAAASGGARGITNNIAFPGGSIATDAGGAPGGVPFWVWALVAGGVLAGFYFIKRHK